MQGRHWCREKVCTLQGLQLVELRVDPAVLVPHSCPLMREVGLQAKICCGRGLHAGQWQVS